MFRVHLRRLCMLLLSVIRALLAVPDGFIFTWFFVIFDSWCWYVRVWVSGSSSRFFRFALEETVLHQAAQSAFLDMSAGVVIGQVELLWGSILCEATGQAEVRGGGVCQLMTAGQDCWLGALLKCECRMGFTVAWIVWSGLVDNRDYSAVGGAMSYLPCPGRAAGWDSNRARMCTESPGQVRLSVSLCR